MSFNKSVFALAALAAASAVSAMSIDTTPAWNGSHSVAPFGEPDTSTFGQSITLGAEDGELVSFTFFLSALDLDLRAYVIEWDGAKAVGPALFTSQTFNIGEGFHGIKPVTVVADRIVLAAGKRYVLAVSSSGLQAGRFNTNAWGALRTDAYAGGEFVFHNSGNDLQSLWSDAGWDCGDGCGFVADGADLAFKAVIEPVVVIPEPSALAMMLAGVGLLAARRKMRR